MYLLKDMSVTSWLLIISSRKSLSLLDFSQSFSCFSSYLLTCPSKYIPHHLQLSAWNHLCSLPSLSVQEYGYFHFQIQLDISLICVCIDDLFYLFHIHKLCLSLTSVQITKCSVGAVEIFICPVSPSGYLGFDDHGKCHPPVYCMVL